MAKEFDDLDDVDLTGVSDELIREVANWKLEAKGEDGDRYFYHFTNVSSLETGEKCFVIGRKGTGKTAISEYLRRISSYDVFSEKLSFKNFPFNELYDLKNEGYTGPNKYITIWKYLIYSSICKLMTQNEKIDSLLRAKLKEVYGNDPASLSRRVSKWVAKEFKVKLPGVELKLGGDVKRDFDEMTWIDKVSLLEDVIIQFADSSRYYIIFDELDEDYRNIIDTAHRESYLALITSLFKAVQDIKHIFRDSTDIKILPVVFLRDDIYTLIHDADKNKWSDFKIELNWDQDTIKRLMAYRITKALNPEAKSTLSFDNAWSKLMGKQTMLFGRKGKKKTSSFDYIARSTLLRPRDFIKYLQTCAAQAQVDGIRINAQIIKKVDKEFSNYLRDEFEDELCAIFPDISEIFDVIAQMRRWNFSIREFERAYNDKSRVHNLVWKDAKAVLRLLFAFSVVGNCPRAGFFVFRYTNKSANFNHNERVIVHRGLFKSLQIV